MDIEAKEKPILFNGEMVRAILSGQKTQTRRIMKVQPNEHDHKMYGEIHGANCTWANEPPEYYDTGDNRWACRLCGDGIDVMGNGGYKCPYGQVGDEIWVRETYYQSGYSYQTYPEDEEYRGWSGSDLFYSADGIPPCRGDGEWGKQSSNEERAKRGSNFFPDKGSNFWRKKPSIHMFRKHSRIQLKVKRVWVERVQDISEDDAIDEGIDICPGNGGEDMYFRNYLALTKADEYFLEAPKKSFESLWNSIYNTWDENPWVWACEFVRIVK